MQGFVAGHSVAYAFISEEQRAGPAINGTSEQGTAMKRYGTVAMNYIQLSAHERSDEGAGSRTEMLNVTITFSPTWRGKPA